MKKYFKIITFLFLGTAAFLSADGNETIDLLKSADIMSAGGWYTSELSPVSDNLNPAASARQQRVTLNAGYTALIGDQTFPGYGGTAVNVGASLPTKSGVITGTGFIIATQQLAELNAGFQGGVNLSFAKELYPGFLAGAGVNAAFGESWAVTADIGIIQELGDIGIMQDFSWAAVLGNMGYSGFSTTDSSSIFTPALGAGFNLIESDNFDWDVNADLSFPTFTNVRLNIGTGVSLFDFAGIRISSAADLNELLAGDVSALIPAAGLYFNFKTNFKSEEAEKSGWSQNDIKASVAAAPLANGLWAAGAGATVNVGVIDNVPPVIEMDLSGFESGGIEDGGADAGGDEPEAAPGGDEDGEGSDEVSFDRKTTIKLKSYGTLKRTVSDDDDRKGPEKAVNKGNIDGGPNGEKIITYLSPNNDGVKDYMEVPISIQDSRYIKGFAFIIEDEAGNTVKKIENKEKRPENAGLANFFERLFYVEKGVDIPESIRWDGIDDGGKVVEDGFYRFYIEAWDDNGNRTATNKYGLVIDNTPPELQMEEPDDLDKIFSPNDDGNKDDFQIVQSGSSEDRWTAVIKSADGREHKNFVWEKTNPESFSWDGKDNKKILVPDGVYFYYIRTVDRAGNVTEGEISNIIINTQSTPISLAVDAANFAPGIEGSVYEVNFTPDIPVKTGIAEWVFEVKNASGRVYYTEKGEGTIPENFKYDGAADAGYIPEGRYKGFLELNYINGNNPSAISPEVTADKTAPSASAKVSERVFSPNGDGNKDSVTIYQETSIENVWNAEISDAEGRLIRSYRWVNNAEPSFEWDGYNDEGMLAKDGEYSYRLFTEDPAGNRGESESVSFRLDTEETPVIMTANLEAFSPNGDGVKEQLRLNPVLNVNEGIQSYRVEILNAGKERVKLFEGRGSVRDSFEWNGFGDDGRKVPDGVYSAAIEVVYDKGDVSRAATRSFVLDSVYPSISVASDYILFSPDGDGRLDSVKIKQRSSREDLVSAVIKNGSGETVREYLWTGNAGDIEWDGTDKNGNRLPDGKYSYEIVSEDQAGNRTVQKVEGIEIDTRISNVFATVSSKGFTPDGDGMTDRMEFSVMTTLADGVKDWSLDILKDGSESVRSFGGDVLPEKVIWDGKDENGRIAEGVYSAVYRVRYYKGNEPESVTKEFALDISAPDTSISISPRPFSPDNDGVDDELSIDISVRDANAIESWSLEVVDREGNAFTFFGGSGAPAESIHWDGIGKNGELVIAAEDYPYKLRVRDEFGNEAVKYGVIPVDVLVVKEGDRLKIRIANITFAPDSAELRKDDPEIKEKNIYILGRLAEILQKYDSYRIVIEGHAVSVFWADAARAEKEQVEELLPLSKARAETVKYYLQQLGISAGRMSTEGIGGQRPIVPHSDLENRWKNRRVEFILLKK